MPKPLPANDIILQALEQGKGPGFEKLIDAFQPEITGFLRRHGANKKEAEEIFYRSLQVLHHRAVVERAEMPACRSFLFSVARCQWLNECRRKKKFVSGVTPEEAAVFNIDDEADILAAIQKVEIQNLVRRHIAALGEPCRGLLTIFLDEDPGFEEIAARTGKSNAAAARKLKERCMEKLEKSLSTDRTYLEITADFKKKE